MIPYAYPTVSVVSSVELGDAADRVTAFRADSVQEWTDKGAQERYRFTRLPVLPDGSVAPQTRLSGTYGYYALGIVANYPVYSSHSVALRLYRPGYELVEIESWETPDHVTWKQAPDPAEQERVLDSLFLTTDKTAYEDRWPVFYRRLEPGSVSAAHREALLFGAGEYERLATVTPSEAVRQRLTEKAGALRTLAAK
jgi:hypothetical protein